MPKSLNWKFLFEANIEKRSVYLNYIDIEMNARTEKTNKSNCTLCKASNQCHDNHQMQTSRLSDAKYQDIKYKSCHCLKTNKYIFYLLNQNNINDDDEEQELVVFNNTNK